MSRIKPVIRFRSRAIRSTLTRHKDKLPFDRTPVLIDDKLYIATGLDLLAVADPFTGEQITLPEWQLSLVPVDQSVYHLFPGSVQLDPETGDPCYTEGKVFRHLDLRPVTPPRSWLTAQVELTIDEMGVTRI